MSHSKESIQALLRTNDRALARGIVAIYKRQTASEQASEATLQDNGVGFTGCDAHILSSFAKQVQKGWTLSIKQNAIARNKMPKYWKQLLEVSMENEHKKALLAKKAEDESYEDLTAYAAKYEQAYGAFK